MQLHDRLQICLLALSSRYPAHVVDINEVILGSQDFGAEGWAAPDLIEMLVSTRPDLLQAMAHMVVDTQKCAIYLVDYSRHVPAFLIHCRGKIPSCQGNVAERQRIETQIIV